jgi:hypothetical protein
MFFLCEMMPKTPHIPKNAILGHLSKSYTKKYSVPLAHLCPHAPYLFLGGAAVGAVPPLRSSVRLFQSIGSSTT